MWSHTTMTAHLAVTIYMAVMRILLPESSSLTFSCQFSSSLHHVLDAYCVLRIACGMFSIYRYTLRTLFRGFEKVAPLP